jgi:hypothetical protein
MQFTYRDLEQLTGIAYYTLAQWKQRGYIDADGYGAGTKNDPVTFTDEMVHRLLWVAQLTQLGMTAPTALRLWAEAVTTQQTLLIATEEGHEWMDDALYAKRVSKLFENHPIFFAISVPHFMEQAKSRVASFERIRKVRGKIGIMEKDAALVH